MARNPRFNIAGIPQHVVQRGNNRQPCFLDERDYRRYLDHLGNACGRSGCSVHAYVLMPNHVHLLVSADEAGGQSRMMQSLGRRYVRYFNDRHGRSGTLWEGRFKASLVDSDAYLLTCMRYIELNPVRAGLCSCPGDYPWSSYRSNAHGNADPLVAHHSLYRSLAVSPGDRLRAYRDLFRSEIDARDLGDIRQAIRQQLALGAVASSERRESGSDQGSESPAFSESRRL